VIRAFRFAIAGLAFGLVGCATLDTWLLDDPAGDSVSIRRVEERMERFLRSVEVEGGVKDWYTLNGYYLIVRTPLHLRSTFRTRIPYVVCSGTDHKDPLEMQNACRLLELPLRSASIPSLEHAHETQHR
jgi:hypothetical protein